ncbi:MAG: DUF6580 family putative transport protein [Patescibacteria group bacterium]
MIYYLLILLGILTRFLPHPANFTAIGAIALFSGYYLKNKKMAIIIPLVIMFLSDWRIGLYQWQLMASVYLSFVIVVFLGILIREKKWFFSLPMSLFGTIIFFLVTNWAVWQFTNWYPHNFPGLISCYLAGLPFIKNSFAGDLTYTFSLFALTELIIFWVKTKKSKISYILVGNKS